MKISIVHATARVTSDFEHPWWEAARSAAIAALRPQEIEYVLAVHHSRLASFWKHMDSFRARLPEFGRFVVAVNCDRDCIADQSNAGVMAATGDIQVGSQDDIRFPPHWDAEVCELIPDTSKPVVLRVSGNPQRPDLFMPTICTRTLQDEIGPFSPEYISMYQDDEWSAKARRLATVVPAQHLTFEHLHPIYGQSKEDAIYSDENKREAYVVGQRVFLKRQAQGFPRVELPGFRPAPSSIASKPAANGNGILKKLAGVVAPPSPVIKRKIAACLPGEDHQRIATILSVQNFFESQGYDFDAILGHVSSPDVTRINIAQTVLDTTRPGETPYVWWVDDDNVVSAEHMRRLYTFLEEHREADLVAGWCWIQRGAEWTASFGEFRDDKRARLYTWADIAQRGILQPFRVERMASGFPCVLMRREVLEKLGANAFQTIHGEDLPYGRLGEDFSFFWRAQEAGIRCYVDPMVKCPHLKFISQEPDVRIPAGVQVSPEVEAAMLAIKGKPVEAGPEYELVRQ